jgi:hypothetical protein
VPTASSINFSKGAVLSNFVSTGVAEYSSTILNVVAIYAAQTTHVILDVAGLSLPGYEYAKYTLGAPNTARLRRAQAAMRADRGRA